MPSPPPPPPQVSTVRVRRLIAVIIWENSKGSWVVTGKFNRGRKKDYCHYDNYQYAIAFAGTLEIYQPLNPKAPPFLTNEGHK